MTIVQTALEKAKQLAKARDAGDSRPDRSSSDRNMGRSQRRTAFREDASAIQPGLGIIPREVTVNEQLCRDNCVLLPSIATNSAVAVAAYRMLRTRILHRARAKNWVTIGVTSASPNDGKTLTSVNLSLSLAREKNSDVVLLDLDMRNPSICRNLGIEPPHQVRDFFENQADSQDLFMSIGVENLLLAGNTIPSPNASELLASSRFEDLIGFIRKGTTNPLVLIDLPPVLATDDTLVLAPRLDAIMVVVAESSTARVDLNRALGLLSEFEVAGLVLNRSSERMKKYAYGYGGEYGGY